MIGGSLDGETTGYQKTTDHRRSEYSEPRLETLPNPTDVDRVGRHTNLQWQAMWELLAAGGDLLVVDAVAIVTRENGSAHEAPTNFAAWQPWLTSPDGGSHRVKTSRAEHSMYATDRDVTKKVA